MKFWSVASVFAIALSGCRADYDPVASIGLERPKDIGLYLNLSTPPEPILDLGQFEVVDVTKDSIRFRSSEGGLCDPDFYDRAVDNFNFNGLYHVVANGASYYFRHGGQHCNEPETVFDFVNWANGRVPEPGTWAVSVVEKDIEQDGHTSMVTIGDSNTWWLFAQTLRARLDQHRPDFVFVGSRTDGYGYGHDGEGADKTTDVMARLEWIPPADTYLLNIGTNDRSDTDDTVDNIKSITASLLEKQAHAIVYLCTIIPRIDSYDLKNQVINNDLRAWAATQPRVRLIDLESEFRALGDWESYMLPDKIHPNDEGYVELARIIAERL